MKTYHLLLAYYSAAVSTGLFVWAAFFATTPDRLNIALLVLPISIYFWLISAGVKRDKSPDTKSSRLHAHLIIPILLAFFLTAASLRLYMERDLSTESQVSSELSSQLDTIQKDVDTLYELSGSIDKLSIKLDALQDTINEGEIEGIEPIDEIETTPAPKDNKTVTSIKSAVIYRKPYTGSDQIGSIQADETLEYTKKQGDWYLITGAEKDGWVEAKYFK